MGRNYTKRAKLVSEPREKQVLDFLSKQLYGQIAFTKIQEHLGVNLDTCSNTLRSLAAQGKVTDFRIGQCKYYKLVKL